MAAVTQKLLDSLVDAEYLSEYLTTAEGKELIELLIHNFIQEMLDEDIRAEYYQLLDSGKEDEAMAMLFAVIPHLTTSLNDYIQGKLFETLAHA